MRRRGDLAAGEEARLVAHGAHGFEQRDGIEVEDRHGAGLVAGLHAVAGQAEDVGDAHRGGAEHVALDGDAVAVAAGDLQHRRVAHAGQKRADADRRHVAVGAGRIDGVDGVHPAVERRDAVVDVLRVGGIGRVQLGGDGELAAPQHALQPPARGMAGQRIERQVDAGRILVALDHGGIRITPVAFSRSCRGLRRHAQPGGGLAQRMVDRLLQREDGVAAAACGGCPPRPAPRRRACPARPRNGRWRARRRRGRSGAASGSSSGRTCRSRRGCTGRTCGSRTEGPSPAARRISPAPRRGRSRRNSRTGAGAGRASAKRA